MGFCGMFHPFAEQVLTLKIMRGVQPIESVTAAVKGLHGKLDVLNKILAEQQYMGGKDFSFIDILYVPMVDMLHKAGEGPAFEKRENLRAWWESREQGVLRTG
ncbi:hypothetical protein QQZ08_008543 [Neonectria magnoliae]|uniref:GST C-terminal domain-containing protein n=1 Tax=Neonectria magnoliae TaxID=2732573 RepID=A0ABR1HTW6_9HYPO